VVAFVETTHKPKTKVTKKFTSPSNCSFTSQTLKKTFQLSSITYPNTFSLLKMAPEISVNPMYLSEKAHQAPPRRAYVTFLAGNGDYVKGVVGLAKGLRKVKSAYPLVVAMLPDVPEEHREILRSQGCVVREIEPVYPPDNQVEFAMAYYVLNYSKLRIWNVSYVLYNYLT